MPNNIDSVFQSIEKTKAQLAAEDKKKAEQEKNKKRQELQNNAFMRRWHGGTDEDLKPLTPEEEDLAAGRDMEHLKMVDGIVCRIDDAGTIVAPPAMAEKYKPIVNVDDALNIQPKEEEDKKPAYVPQKINNISSTIKKQTEISKQEQLKTKENNEDNLPSTVPEQQVQLKESKQPQTRAPDNVQILSPDILLNGKTKIYFATSYNEHLQKAAYAAIIKRLDDTDILIGNSFPTKNPADGMYIGIIAALSAFDDLNINSVTIYAKKDITRALRRNSSLIMDEYTQAAGNYLKYIKQITTSKYIGVSPRESRLDIQIAVQAIADGMTADFAKDPDYEAMPIG